MGGYWTLLCPLAVALGMVVVGVLLSGNVRGTKESGSPYECGLDVGGEAHKTFSLHFFLLALLFLVFDVEVVLLFPFLAFKAFSPALAALFFLGVLILGLAHEWGQGTLGWGV